MPLSDDRAVVSIMNENAEFFELRIHAEDGELIYYKQTTKPLNTYQKIFDFKNLENGNYTMDLRIKDTRLLKDFSVSAKGITVGESKLRIDPYFAFADGILKLSYLNFDQEQLNLNIYDEKGLVYETSLGKDFNIASGYDLSALNEGKYEVVISSLKNNFLFSLVK
ncbi:hypothetical protein [Draconibacterium orientale]|uniref:hypothetical protein n=1 Tax=Draconibacterium orientale TaxID=1168034 RepID=UPI0029C0EEA0|nr:hypothetical protein [Draconibacterium orientale]